MKFGIRVTPESAFRPLHWRVRTTGCEVLPRAVCCYGGQEKPRLSPGCLVKRVRLDHLNGHAVPTQNVATKSDGEGFFPTVPLSTALGRNWKKILCQLLLPTGSVDR